MRDRGTNKLINNYNAISGSDWISKEMVAFSNESGIPRTIISLQNFDLYVSESDGWPMYNLCSNIHYTDENTGLFREKARLFIKAS